MISAAKTSLTRSSCACPFSLGHHLHYRPLSQETQEGSHDPQFEPVIKLTEQVEAKTHEEDEEVLFKMYLPYPLP